MKRQLPLTGVLGSAYADDTHRFYLSRTWANGPRLLWVMLNPSTADEALDDPTIRKCRGFTKRNEYGTAKPFGSFSVVNLFAARATDPRQLRLVPWLTMTGGVENDRHIKQAADDADVIVVAWGAHGERFRDRAHEVLSMLKGRELWCLGRTKSGDPVHPLMVPYKTRFERFHGLPFKLEVQDHATRTSCRCANCAQARGETPRRDA